MEARVSLRIPNFWNLWWQKKLIRSKDWSYFNQGSCWSNSRWHKEKEVCILTFNIVESCHMVAGKHG